MNMFFDEKYGHAKASLVVGKKNELFKLILYLDILRKRARCARGTSALLLFSNVYRLSKNMQHFYFSDP